MPAVWGKIRAEEILAPIKGSLISGEPDTPIRGISTDSRTLRTGELFWALKGDTYNGHDFAARAVEQGAAGVVVEKRGLIEGFSQFGIDSRGSSSRSPVVISVDDTLKALGRMAAWWRRMHDLKVVAITGSSGKTTTKEMVSRILEMGARTLKNQGNLNNLIGLPLTLLKLTRDHERAVVEMGMNRPGEIARLTEIADPDVGVILNVGMAHLEGLGDLDGVARAKTELMEKISPKGVMILNGDDEPLMRRASSFTRETITFGLGPGNQVRATRILGRGQEGTAFHLEYQKRSWPVRIKVPGLHNVKNALAAAAVGLVMKEPFENIVEGLGRFSGIRGRFMLELLTNGAALMDDTYNSNPCSLEAALHGVASMKSPHGRLMVGLGEMMELGDSTVQAHRKAGERAAKAGAYSLLAMGEHSREITEGARAGGMPPERLKIVRSHDEMVKEIGDTMRQGDLILLKGSRKMGLEKVAEGLRELSLRTAGHASWG